jgi:glycosyltransferase involved in cell wall biosynthesis/SAM-dependent methyltransferase
MRLAVFTPLPPLRSGIADYNAELLPHLAPHADLTVFVDQAPEAVTASGPWRLRHHTAFEAEAAAAPFDLCVYHQGNNPHHAFVYRHAVARPGLVVLHDLTLHHLLAHLCVERGAWGEYRDELFYSHGAAGLRLAALRERGVWTDTAAFLLPAHRRLVERSLGLLVHSQHAAQALGPAGRPVVVVRHHLGPVPAAVRDLDRAGARRRLGLPADRVLIGCFGFVTPPKRMPVVLRALDALRREGLGGFQLLIVGEDHPREGIGPSLRASGWRDEVQLTGFVDLETLHCYIKAVDISVNLRYPSAGETSGTLTRCLGAGAAVVLSDYAQYAEYPDECCLKVPLGAGEVEALAAHLRRLLTDRTLREGLGEAARRWIGARCRPEASAQGYLRAVAAARAAAGTVRLGPVALAAGPADGIRVPDEGRRWVEGFFAGDPAALGYLRQHWTRIRETLAWIPRGGGAGRLLELGSYLQMTPLLRRDGRFREIHCTGYVPGEPARGAFSKALVHAETGERLSFPFVHCDLEADPLPFPDGYFTVVVCTEILEHLARDPMHMLLECHRVLTWNGWLVLTTPNVASAASTTAALAGNTPYLFGAYRRDGGPDRHNREYVPREVAELLEQAGFRVERLEALDPWGRPADPAIRARLEGQATAGENIFALGRKASPVATRYPRSLYV